MAEAILDPTRDSLLTLVRDCPSPGVIVSRSRTILGYNTAFAHWLGPGPRVLAGSELTDVLQVRTTLPLGVRQGSVRHPAAVEGTATGGQRNGYTDCQ